MRAAAKTQAAAPKRKERVKGDIVKPDYLLRLMEHMGPTAAAKEIGTTPGTLHKARNAHAVSRPLEVAARGIWFEKGYAEMDRARAEPPARTTDLGEAVHAPTSEGVSLLLVQVPKGREAIVQKTVEAIGGSVAVQA